MRRDDRWQNLVHGSFNLCERLDQARRSGESVGLDDALAYLSSVLEVFPATLDPVDDFEGYAVRRMALALREAIRAERD
ncbi:hypothetical protein [Vulgatibacter incomptus]|uniref:Uncharacterized protein n=1 Tax=Vulgatibacter incomptus TaxID=1391653 RepID=A0A0K1P9L8_9BACT|nr:hypothetical protein [Vulgatibacter incomptus]AKU90131.1 hypothetical protein AKJ08_0518 [Vulgatibacter incomptus]